MAGTERKGISTMVTLVDGSRVDLKDIVAHIASIARLTECPQVMLEEGVGAHAKSKVIFIGLKLASYLKKDELTGVVAHEFRHSSLGGRLLRIEQLYLVFIFLVVAAFLCISDELTGLFQPIFVMIIMITYFLPSRRYFARRGEFEADIFAKDITGVRHFSSALEIFDRLKRSQGEDHVLRRVFDPHPSLEERLEKIAQSARS